MVNLNDIIEFWETENSGYHQTESLFNKIRAFGFDNDVPDAIKDNIMKWMNAQMGAEAAKHYYRVKRLLSDNQKKNPYPQIGMIFFLYRLY